MWRNIKEFLDFLGFIAPIALVIGVFVAAVCGMCAAAARYECGYYARQTGVRTEFSIVAGCYVESGDKMIPYSEFKARAITNEEAAK